MPQSHPTHDRDRGKGLRLRHRGVRSIVAILLIVITCLAFTGFLVVRYAEEQLFSTEGWVSYSSQLPQNPDVSWAVADALVKQIFVDVAVEQKIKQALPERAGFLASPLSDQLQTRSITVVQKLVQSDTFQSLWVGANRLAIDRFLTNARSSETQASADAHERFTIDLTNAMPQVRGRLASQAELLPDLQQKRQDVLAIRTDLQNRRERLWQIVRTADLLYAVLPAMCIAAFLGALVFAVSRRRAIMFTAGLSLAFLLITLIAIKYVGGQIMGGVEEPYMPAASFIYDSLVVDLRETIFYSLGVWAVVLVACLLAGPSRWATALRKFLRLDGLAKTRPADWWRSLRVYVARHRGIFWLGIIGMALVYLAFFAVISTAVVINSLLLAVCGVLLVQLVSRPPAKIS